MSAFDRRLARTSLAYSALAAVVTLAVVVATDEPDATTPQRAARMGVFMPAIAAFGSALALAHSRARGEGRALAALGVSPFRFGHGARVAGWLAGAVALCLLSASASGVSSLFPAVHASSDWYFDGGAFVDPVHGVRVRETGEMAFVAPRTGRSSFAPDRGAALLAVAPLAVLLPIWVCVPLRRLWRFIGGVLTLAALTVVLHGVAASRLGLPWLLLSALPLALQIALAQRRFAWR